MSRERAERKVPIKIAQLDEELVSGLEGPKSLLGHVYGYGEGEFPWRENREPKSIVCFGLDLSEGRVIFAIACPPEFAKKVEVLLDEQGHLLVRGEYYGVTQRLDLGDPKTGGGPEIGGGRAHRVVGLDGRKIPRDSYLWSRRLLADALRNNFGPDRVAVVLVGLGKESAINADFSLVKMVDERMHEASPESLGDKLAEFILATLQDG